MEIQKHMCLIVLIYALGVLSSSKVGCGSMFRGFSDRSCIESEKQALLVLKENLTDNWNHLLSWTGDDCCAWHGITCNNKTGHIIKLDLQNGYLRGDQINSSLADLKYLTYLDLSNNSFDYAQIPEFLGSFKYLTYLNLSYCNFEGLVPHHLGNLSSLLYLDLRSNLLLEIDSMSWLSKLSLLEYLDLSGLELYSALESYRAIDMLPNSILVLKLYFCRITNIPGHLPFMNLTSLSLLDLGSNQLNSSFPSWILNNSALERLRLSDNYFDGPIPISIKSLTSLSLLDLSNNKFQGFIPECIGDLTLLTKLDLSWNNLRGSIPQSIGNLTSLSVLDLSFNNFQGLIPQSIGNLASLSTLVISVNKLNDSIPPEIGNLKKLAYIDITSNQLSGFLPESLCELSNLKIFYAHNNQLRGIIPKCIGQLSNLEYLMLTSNSWDGILSEHHFANLTRLTDLGISSKSNLVLNFSSEWVPPFQLQSLYMGSLKAGPKFPQWLSTQRQLTTISMQNTSISDAFPVDWFVSVLSKADSINLSDNNFNGIHFSLIIAAPNGLTQLTLSNNQLSGEIPSFLCHLTSLEVLVLSDNNFSGKLPQCLGNLTELRDLDVMNNTLSGDIPISLGFLGNLTYLNLHNNEFQGKLPMSFQNLEELVALDVGKNNLRDMLPSWTREQLPHLTYLILWSNNFYGDIPTQLCQYSSIQVLDLARNQIKGNIPPCFGNFSTMITSDNNDQYPIFLLDGGEIIMDDTKGYEQKYTSTLRFLFSIDLSNNNLSGEIPEELTNLHGLLNLNLAGNHLTGQIPERIGKMEKLESLDLSRNELSGPIPQSLSDLNFLSHLNLSFNDLSGRIPTGNQLQTLDNDTSIYAGNNQLCGLPNVEPCESDMKSHHVHENKEGESNSDDQGLWFYAGIGPGLFVGFLGFCATLHFIDSWRHSYFHYVEQVLDKIALTIALLWRKFLN